MAIYTPLADTAVEAFQWTGDPLSDYVLPGWANTLALHAPSDGTLDVPCWNGTFGARMGDWIVKDMFGAVTVVSNGMFSALYDVDAVAVEETRRTAEEQIALAAEARAAAARQKHDAAVARARETKAAPVPPAAKPAAAPVKA